MTPDLVTTKSPTARHFGGLEIPVLASPWKTDEAYHAYVQRQVEKTQAYQRAVMGSRVAELVGLWVRALQPDSPIDRSVLAVGCRNIWELDILHAAGFGPVVGIDLSSQDTRIVPMDMHQLTFADGLFDSVFASHSLEHSYDPRVVVQEWVRVTRPGGCFVVEVPLNFVVSPVDRQNFLTVLGVVDLCRACVCGEVLEMDEPTTRRVGRLVYQRA